MTYFEEKKSISAYVHSVILIFTRMEFWSRNFPNVNYRLFIVLKQARFVNSTTLIPWFWNQTVVLIGIHREKRILYSNPLKLTICYQDKYINTIR
jgi:hypothetical protein